MVREPFAADLPRSIEQANTTFTTSRPLQEDGDECYERRNFEWRERDVASNFNVDAGDTRVWPWIRFRMRDGSWYSCIVIVPKKA